MAWTAGDFLRSAVPIVASRASLAYALFDQPSLIQPVSITGIAGLNLLILTVNWILAATILSRLRRRAGPGLADGVGRGRAVVAAAVVCWVIASVVMLDEPEAVVRVAAIQPGTDSGDETELARNIEQTRAAAAESAEVIVWREKTLSFDPREQLSETLRDLARETDAYLVIGYGVDTPSGQRNEATVISPAGEFLGV